VRCFYHPYKGRITPVELRGMDLTEIWISEAPFYDFNAKCAADGVRSFDGAMVEVGSA